MAHLEHTTSPNLDAGAILNTIDQNGMSFSLWVRPATVDGTYRKFINRADGDVIAVDQWGLQISSANKIEFFAVASTNVYVVVPHPTTVVAGTWYYVYCTLRQQGTTQIECAISFNNGTMTTQGSIPFSPTTAASRPTLPLLVGTGRTGSGGGPVGYPYLGRIDSFGIWNRILSTPERDSLWNSGSGRQHSDLTASEKVGLLSWYDFDEATGSTTWQDMQQNNHLAATGTVVSRGPRNT